MYRRIWQHHSHIRIIRRYGWCKMASDVLLKKYDWLLITRQIFIHTVRSDHAFSLNNIHIFHHYREGLHRTILKLSQSCHSLFVFSVAA